MDDTNNSEDKWAHLRKVRDVPVGLQSNPYQRWVKNNTRKTAIDAFCMNCMGTEDPDNPQAGYRTDIRNCPSTKCPLYVWRPYK